MYWPKGRIKQQGNIVADVLEETEAYSSFGSGNTFNDSFDGEKFFGGFGATRVGCLDYWALRERSAMLFHENSYARGIIRRIVRNKINTGLYPEMIPEEQILGLEEGYLDDWSEETENRWGIWANDSLMVDYYGRSTFAELQEVLDQEALIEGDVLVVMHQSSGSNLPKIQLISGSAVDTPFGMEPAKGNTIEYGVELNAKRQQVGYWVRKEGGKYKRISAVGRKSGRRQAWLYYGTDKRYGNVRGEPLLSIILQSLRELDRYRDAVVRKAVVNSMLAMFVKRDKERIGSDAIRGASIKTKKITSEADGARDFNMSGQIPGVAIGTLQYGEDIQGFQSQVDIDYGTFEKAMISAIAWALEIPPEILQLAFDSNYSASQAALNEFRLTLNAWRLRVGNNFCQPILIEWMISETLNGSINAPGFLQAWRDHQNQYDVFGAWTRTDWTGAIKPTTDPKKAVDAARMAIEQGLTTRARVSRELYGQKQSRVAKMLRRENKILAEINAPLVAQENSRALAVQTDPELDIDDDEVNNGKS